MVLRAVLDGTLAKKEPQQQQEEEEQQLEQQQQEEEEEQQRNQFRASRACRGGALPRGAVLDGTLGRARATPQQ